MYRLVRRFSQNQLLTGSTFMLVGSSLGNFGQFLYNLTIARLLGPQIYGEFGAILASSALIATPLGVLSLILVKRTSVFYGRGEMGKIGVYLNFINRKSIFLGVLIISLFLLFSPFLRDFLQLPSIIPLVIISLSMLLSIPLTNYRSVLRGVLLFRDLTINNTLETYLKLGLTFVFIMMGGGLVGALLGIPLASMIVLFWLVYLLPQILRSPEKSVSLDLNITLREVLPVIIMTFGLVSFYSSDVILVKHFFESVSAGQYAVLSTVGKIILFVSGPVISVMFPLVTVRHQKGENYLLPLLGTLTIVLGIALIISCLFFVFPQLIIGLLFGDKYLSVFPYLGLYSIFTTLYTVNSVLMNFFFSVSDYRPFVFLLLASLAQIILILFFHSSFSGVIWSNIIASVLFLLTSGFYLVSKQKTALLNLYRKYIMIG